MKILIRVKKDVVLNYNEEDGENVEHKRKPRRLASYLSKNLTGIHLHINKNPDGYEYLGYTVENTPNSPTSTPRERATRNKNADYFYEEDFDSSEGNDEDYS